MKITGLYMYGCQTRYNKWRYLVSKKLRHVKYTLAPVAYVYLLWIFIHFAAARLYAELCVPNTVQGLVLSPFLVSSPHCTALLWAVNEGTISIRSMWVLLGAWLSGKMLASPNRKKNKSNYVENTDSEPDSPSSKES